MDYTLGKKYKHILLYTYVESKYCIDFPYKPKPTRKAKKKRESEKE